MSFPDENIDYREQPEAYEYMPNERGVFKVEPYKSELLPLWRFKTPEAGDEFAVAQEGASLSRLAAGDAALGVEHIDQAHVGPEAVAVEELHVKGGGALAALFDGLEADLGAKFGGAVDDEPVFERDVTDLGDRLAGGVGGAAPVDDDARDAVASVLSGTMRMPRFSTS